MSFKPIKSMFINNIIYIILDTDEKRLKLYTSTGISQSVFLNINKPFIKNYFPRSKIEVYRGEHPYGDRIHGLLGCSFFNQRIWNIDYKRNIIALYSLDIYKFIKNRIPAYIKSDSPYLSIPISIDKCEYWFIVDTGAYYVRPPDTYDNNATYLENREPTSFIMESFVDDLIQRKINIKKAEKADHDGRDMILIPSIRIGKYILENPKFIVLKKYCDDTLHTLTDKPIKGSIGGNILKNFNVILNYTESYVWLKKNK